MPASGGGEGHSAVAGVQDQLLQPPTAGTAPPGPPQPQKQTQVPWGYAHSRAGHPGRPASPPVASSQVAGHAPPSSASGGQPMHPASGDSGGPLKPPATEASAGTRTAASKVGKKPCARTSPQAHRRAQREARRARIQPVASSCSGFRDRPRACRRLPASGNRASAYAAGSTPGTGATAPCPPCGRARAEDARRAPAPSPRPVT